MLAKSFHSYNLRLYTFSCYNPIIIDLPCQVLRKHFVAKQSCYYDVRHFRRAVEEIVNTNLSVE